MPKDPTIKRTLVIGSGPISIGQAAEFDYAGTQACQTLKQEGVEVVLVNSNPATIMTDEDMAAHVYIEPLTIPIIKRIIEKENPDSILPSLGGQTGLNLSMQLAQEGYLEEKNIQLLAVSEDAIRKAEDRKSFKQTMEQINQPVIPSVIAETVDEALAFADKTGYPLIIRPAFTLGGSGGGIAENKEELIQKSAHGIEVSPIGQILVEQSVAGWKEIEFEVMRDSNGNSIAVCSMENFDPVGIHTGDSIVVAPALTLADKEYQMLRSAALSIIESLDICGGCNCQFALDPNSFEYAVIEVNPRVSRSSALASKATGYPIAKVATRIAIGYTLPEIPNAVTGGKTSACFEPALDYVVVKLPKWPFDKFVYAKRELGTQMKATGEVMSIAGNFEQALMKAVRGAEIGLSDLNYEDFVAMTKDQIIERLYARDDLRLFAIYAAIKKGITIEQIHEITTIDVWFLDKVRNIYKMEKMLAEAKQLDDDMYMNAKEMGFLDKIIEKLAGPITTKLLPAYKMVDTCAAEFKATTPYFYATYGEENEAQTYFSEHPKSKGTILVFGSGPIRIGQGIEFDYASVHCVWTLRELGYEVAIVNNNPETVSTDFDTADRLYFEPLTAEDVKGVIANEQPVGVVVTFGGQTAIKLTQFLKDEGINILGTDADSIDAAEDRERFDDLLESLDIARPRGDTVFTKEDALKVANKLEYPVLLRPSYVLGGQNMIIAFNDQDVSEYMDVILKLNTGGPVLIDQYLMGTEVEVDAICDGRDVLVPGIMEHIERAGIHSGDSIAVYPPFNVLDEMQNEIIESTAKIAAALEVVGLVNVQYLIKDGKLFVIEVNPRSSRTIPYLSKVTNVPMVDVATRTMLGEKLRDMPYGTGIHPVPPYSAVKVPVFSFEKLDDVDSALGPEMKSTGEVLGLASNVSEALYKGLVAAGYSMDQRGGVLFTVKEQDHNEIYDTAKEFLKLGCKLYATAGNAKVLQDAGLEVTPVKKLSSGSTQILELMDEGKIGFVISTSAKGRVPTRDGVRIRRKAVEKNIPCLTSIDTANALVECLQSRYSDLNVELVDLNNRRTKRKTLQFAKMHASGNDYICFDCINQTINNPAGLGAKLSHRHTGIGGEGIALITPSEVADFKMEAYNLDGDRIKMSGNGIRMIAKYAYDTALVDKLELTINTDDGLKKVKLYKRNGIVSYAEVNMGKMLFAPDSSPIVTVGNSHSISFKDDVDGLDMSREVAVFEGKEATEQSVDSVFVKVLDKTSLRIRTWESGSGETRSSGTGACSAVIAAVGEGYCLRDTDIYVKQPGGTLMVRYNSDNSVILSGEVKSIYKGEVVL